MLTRLSLLSLGLFTSPFSAEVDNWPSTEEDHSKLQVVVPFSLQVEGGYPHRDALFGYPSYNKGSLVSPLVNGNASACEPFTFGDAIPPFAVLLERGGCHFVQKVRNAQHAGASAVVMVDNSCLCTDSECMKTTGDTTCEAVLPFMADDESGSDITIPSMLIRKSDGERIQHAMVDNTNVMVQFDWGIPSPDGRVEWTLWHSSWDEQSVTALKELKPIIEALGDRAFFTPRFVSYNGSKVGCQGGSSSACGNMCLNQGRYCLLDPSPLHDQTKGASGADVVLENLRRKCVWKIASAEDPGVGKKWWTYVTRFGEKCNQDESHFVSSECSAEILSDLDIDVGAVHKCMHPSGKQVDKKNAMLEEELQDQTDLQLLRLPALYVDGVHARGHLNAASALSMICAGYGTHDPPAVCDCATEHPTMELRECITEGSWENLSLKRQEDQSAHSSSSSVLAWLVMLMSGIGIVGVVHYKRSQRHMREQVRSILAEYMPLEDQSDDHGSEYFLDSPRSGHGLHPAVVASAKSPRGFAPSHEYDEERML